MYSSVLLRASVGPCFNLSTLVLSIYFPASHLNCFTLLFFLVLCLSPFIYFFPCYCRFFSFYSALVLSFFFSPLPYFEELEMLLLHLHPSFNLFFPMFILDLVLHFSTLVLTFFLLLTFWSLHSRLFLPLLLVMFFLLLLLALFLRFLLSFSFFFHLLSIT